MDESRTPTEFKAPMKTYYHQNNYARFHFDMGKSTIKSVEFANHRYITDDKREQAQLDAVADMSGTFIYTLPNSDAAVRAEVEREQEKVRALQSTASARAAEMGVQDDKNAPIVPAVAPGAATQLGVAHSFSNVAMTADIPAKAAVVHSAPTAAFAALARLNEMQATAGAQPPELRQQ